MKKPLLYTIAILALTPCSNINKYWPK
ncbi:lipoprotein [Shewanella pealeana]